MPTLIVRKELMRQTRMNCPLILACDDGYAMPLSTTLRSIVDANRSAWPLDFHVMFSSFSEANKKKVIDSLPRRSASIRWVPVDLRPFLGFSTLEYISKITYARFLIPNIFPDNVDRVLYLDADILVLGSLAPLWETNLEENVVGAVLDGMDLQIKCGKSGLEEVPRVQDYFNAGVLLINLDQWRKKQISEKALNYLIQHPRSPFSDQDAINVSCDGLWKKLDSRWNTQIYYENKKISDISPELRPRIVHFVTRAKPWDASIPNMNASFYDAFRNRTCFARTSEEKFFDVIRHAWAWLKNILKQYPILRVIWKLISSRKSKLVKHPG